MYVCIVASWRTISSPKELFLEWKVSNLFSRDPAVFSSRDSKEQSVTSKTGGGGGEEHLLQQSIWTCISLLTKKYSLPYVENAEPQDIVVILHQHQRQHGVVPSLSGLPVVFSFFEERNKQTLP
jgi:hypothetical protein